MKKHLLMIACSFFLLSFFTGCEIVIQVVAHTILKSGIEGEHFQHEKIDSNVAVIYVYRLAKADLGGRSPEIFVNGKSIEEIHNGGYYSIKLNPGSHEIESESLFLISSSSITVSVSGGEEQFIEFKIDTFSSFEKHSNVEGLKRIQRTRLQSSVNLVHSQN